MDYLPTLGAKWLHSRGNVGNIFPSHGTSGYCREVEKTVGLTNLQRDSGVLIVAGLGLAADQWILSTLLQGVRPYLCQTLILDIYNKNIDINNIKYPGEYFIFTELVQVRTAVQNEWCPDVVMFAGLFHDRSLNLSTLSMSFFLDLRV